ncbi:hypothetical protein CLOM_g8417 [Closterium sp. NIES-68]|nr:hypothetical protein CLOM_g8417 [Closterium sp. NIES-68]GJP78020.1 hypothetical protein CLOP_g8353 [Closterium sp. NIES-67]
MARHQQQQRVSGKPHSAGAVWVRFAVTSVAMWVLPLAVLFSLKQDLSFLQSFVPAPIWSLLARSDPSAPPIDATFWAGLAAVLSVNAVIAVYIILALRDSPVADQPHPDPAFVATAARRQQEIADLGGEGEEGDVGGGGSGGKGVGGGRSSGGLRKRRQDMTAGEAEAEAMAAAARVSGTGLRRAMDRKGKKQS